MRGIALFFFSNGPLLDSCIIVISDAAIDFLRKQAESIGLEFRVIEVMLTH